MQKTPTTLLNLYRQLENAKNPVSVSPSEYKSLSWLIARCQSERKKLDLESLQELRGKLVVKAGLTIEAVNRMQLGAFVELLKETANTSEGTGGIPGSANTTGTAEDHGPARQAGRKLKRKRGRRPATEPKNDKRIWEAWKTGQHKDYAHLAQSLGKTKYEVKAAMDRHRKRIRPRKPAPE